MIPLERGASADGQGFDTRCLHAGHRPDPTTGAATPAIHQTTSYVFPDADAAAARYALEGDGHVYSRISNPTVEVLETRLASLEGGTGAVATASGMAALDSLVLVLASSGDTVVCSTDVYGGTAAYLSRVCSRRGIDVRFVPTLDYEAYERAIDDSTAFVHVETMGNPSLVTPDIERLASIAHDRGVPLAVDNTFATPAGCRPLEYGADVVWESTTKWITGSGTTVGGVLVDGGRFLWAEYPDRYPEVGGENGAYDGVTFAEAFPDAPLAAAVRFRASRSLGNAQSPFDAWQTLQGLETLPLRRARHAENAAIVAEYLDSHDDVAWVTYPGLDSHPTHENARRYLDDFGGVVAFGIDGGFEAGKRVCETVDLVSFLANVGDARTLVIHPASSTHGQLSPAERAEAGVSDELIRLSVGLEEPADILADLDRAIHRARGKTEGSS